MLEGKPLFPGKDHVNQFSIITELLGTPPADVIETICSENTLRFVQSLPKRERIPLVNKFKNAEPAAIDLLESMLVFDPRKRVKATEALAHAILPHTTTPPMSRSRRRSLIGHSTTQIFL